MATHRKRAVILCLALVLALLVSGTAAAEEEDRVAPDFEHPSVALLGAYFESDPAEFAAYHEQGLGFGVLVKLYAIAAESQEACATGQSAQACVAVTVEGLVAAFRSGTGMGELFRQHGRPSVVGVGQMIGAAGGPPNDPGPRNDPGPPNSGGPPNDAGPPGHAGPPDEAHSEILDAFHTEKDACQEAFFDVLDSFLSEKDALISQLQQVAQSDADDKEGQIAGLQAQLDALEADKDAAEAEKDECIAAAEAAKDAALADLEQEVDDDADEEDDEDTDDLGDAGLPHGTQSEILDAFHAQKDACQQAFFDAQDYFHSAKDALQAQLQQVEQSGGENKDAQKESLKAQMEALEAQKDAAEATKDACIAAAEATKDAALASLE